MLPNGNDDARPIIVNFNGKGNDNVCLGGLDCSNEQRYSDFRCILDITRNEGKETLRKAKNRIVVAICQATKKL